MVQVIVAEVVVILAVVTATAVGLKQVGIVLKVVTAVQSLGLSTEHTERIYTSYKVSGVNGPNGAVNPITNDVGSVPGTE